MKNRGARLWRLIFEQAKTRAAKIVTDPKELRRLVKDAIAKMGSREDIARESLDNLRSICRLISAWASGEYRDVSLETVILLIAAVIYFLMPIDAMPDMIPVVGFMDDLAVVGFVVASVRSEIEKFRRWEKGGLSSVPTKSFGE
jgi:uncharacterized membrane protein YkvA (DUF1232 family)